MIRGLTFNDKHNYKDFNLILERKTILPPGKKKIKIDVPFMNGSYDFSNVGTGGEPMYTERTIEVTLGLPTRSKENLHVMYSMVLEWLQDTGRGKLIFDDICDYYFIAEVEGVPSFEEMLRFGKLNITFIAQPFKYGVNLEGSDIWDTFNFEVDVVQATEFDVEGNKTVNIINVGRSVTPIINVNAPMAITINSKNYNLNIGNNKIYGLKLQMGDNSILINGTGHIKFIVRKEML